MKRTPGIKKAKHKEISAGGIIVDTSSPDKTIALIGRQKKNQKLQWVLPKGHQEKGEDLKNTAKREIFEETGLHGKRLSYLGKYNYTFIHENEKILKTVHHYLFQYIEGELHTNDIEVDQAIWIPIDKALTKATFYYDKRIIFRGIRWLENKFND